MSYIYPVILSGGTGSRLWPLSRSNFPKQLLNLTGEHSLIQETALRTVGPEFAKPLIICHAEHRFLVAEQMRAVGIHPSHIVLEPIGRNTAPAAFIAASIIAREDPDAVLFLAPADHVIGDLQVLLRAVDTARNLAQQGKLVTFGVQPRKPETGYGYIQRGTPLLEDRSAFTVSRFVEKPDRATANSYVQAGDYYWNSGMFVFRAGTCISELEKFEPELAAWCRRAISNGKQDMDYLRLDAEAFTSCKAISFDYAVMERTESAAVVSLEMGWNDIGSWDALWDVSDKDAQGNAVMGETLHLDTHNSYLRSDGPLIATLGVKDMVVVACPDAVLVCAKSAAQDVKKIVEQLERRGRAIKHLRI